MTKEQLAEIRERAEGVIGPKWEGYGYLVFAPDCGMVCEMSEPFPSGGAIRHISIGLGSPDREVIMKSLNFIVHARQDIPDLLAELDRLRAERDKNLEVLGTILTDIDRAKAEGRQYG